jgi:hypothetical protein
LVETDTSAVVHKVGKIAIFLLMILIPVAEGITGKFVLFLFSHIVGLGE